MVSYDKNITSNKQTAAYTETPVDAQVYRNNDVGVGEDVHFACPPLDRWVTAAQQLGVEESATSVGLAVALLLPPLHQHVHVEVDHLYNITTTCAVRYVLKC